MFIYLYFYITEKLQIQILGSAGLHLLWNFKFFTPKLRRESRRAPRWFRPHQIKSPRAIGAHLRARRDSCRADFGPILWRGRDGGMKERGRQFGNRFSNSGFLIAHRNFLTNKVKFTIWGSHSSIFWRTNANPFFLYLCDWPKPTYVVQQLTRLITWYGENIQKKIRKKCVISP